MANGPNLAWITVYIWGIADDVLRDVYVRGKYRYVILPMTEQSKIFDNAAFGHWKVTVERPLRLAVDWSEEQQEPFFNACIGAGEVPLADAVQDVLDQPGAGPHRDFNGFPDVVKTEMQRRRIKMTAKRKTLLQTRLAQRDETAAPVVKKVHRRGTPVDPVNGLFEVDQGGRRRVVEYEPDSALRDTEQIPLQEEGGIEGFLQREVLPYAPDAWVVPESVKIGYQISFNRYFYKPLPMRSLAEIRADILGMGGGAWRRGALRTCRNPRRLWWRTRTAKWWSLTCRRVMCRFKYVEMVFRFALGIKRSKPRKVGLPEPNGKACTRAGKTGPPRMRKRWRPLARTGRSLARIGGSRTQVARRCRRICSQQLIQLGDRPRKESVRTVIQAICAVKPWTTWDEIAKHLWFSRKKLGPRHLTPMVEIGWLETRYPKQPTHPSQAYRSTPAFHGDPQPEGA